VHFDSRTFRILLVIEVFTFWLVIGLIVRVALLARLSRLPNIFIIKFVAVDGILIYGVRGEIKSIWINWVIVRITIFFKRIFKINSIIRRGFVYINTVYVSANRRRSFLAIYQNLICDIEIAQVAWFKFWIASWLRRLKQLLHINLIKWLRFLLASIPQSFDWLLKVIFIKRFLFVWISVFTASIFLIKLNILLANLINVLYLWYVHVWFIEFSRFVYFPIVIRRAFVEMLWCSRWRALSRPRLHLIGAIALVLIVNTAGKYIRMVICPIIF